MQDNFILRPVWDWGEQFSDKDLLLFTNPLYRKPVETFFRQSLAVQLPPNAIRLPGIASALTNNRMTLNLASIQQQVCFFYIITIL